MKKKTKINGNRVQWLIISRSLNPSRVLSKASSDKMGIKIDRNRDAIVELTYSNLSFILFFFSRSFVLIIILFSRNLPYEMNV